MTYAVPAFIAIVVGGIAGAYIDKAYRTVRSITKNNH